MAEFGGGLLVGLVTGFFLYPVFWSWIAWREYQRSSRRARRIDEVLADMSDRRERLPAQGRGHSTTTEDRLESAKPIGR
jgi:hypothetical protein